MSPLLSFTHTHTYTHTYTHQYVYMYYAPYCLHSLTSVISTQSKSAHLGYFPSQGTSESSAPMVFPSCSYSYTVHTCIHDIECGKRAVKAHTLQLWPGLGIMYVTMVTAGNDHFSGLQIGCPVAGANLQSHSTIDQSTRPINFITLSWSSDFASLLLQLDNHPIMFTNQPTII